jgi:methyltransferase (TIGR00027 family)
MTGEARPSRTAYGAAVHRAVHQVLEGGRIFADPLAIPVLGEDITVLVREAQEHSQRGRMRLFVTLRTRLAEDALAVAVERGAGQLVVLGAGLDTYAYRGAMRGRLRIFEVDDPATQAWKRERLDKAGIPLPGNLTFVPLDFERDALRDGLSAGGFDVSRRTFFTWLGVAPYLPEETVMATLRFIGGLPGGAEVVFDYSNPPDSLAEETRAVHDVYAARAAEIGEPWVTYFATGALHQKLAGMGLGQIQELRTVPGPAGGAHVLRAAAEANEIK